MKKSRCFLLIQAAVCIALAVWLSAAAVSVCREGSERKAEDPMESIYTPEIVAEKLAPAAPLFIAGAVLLIAGLILGIKDEEAGKPVKNAGFRSDLQAERAARTAGPSKKTCVIQAVILAAAIVFIIAGVFNGSARDVLYKAITICTECVGLG